MSISFCCHVCISSLAVCEYGCEGIGCRASGLDGSVGQAETDGVGGVAQAVRRLADSSSQSLDRFFALESIGLRLLYLC